MKRILNRSRIQTSNDGGQSTVELACIIPFLVLFFVFIIQVALVVRQYVLVTNSARAAARESSVNPNSEYAKQIAKKSAPGSRVQIHRPLKDGEYLTVTVSDTVESSMPIISIVFPDVTVSGKATMRVEK